jgi:hypothetical protein
MLNAEFDSKVTETKQHARRYLAGSALSLGKTTTS